MKNITTILDEAVCLSVCGVDKESRDAIARSYSPRTIKLLQDLGATTYNPKVRPGCVLIGGAKKELLTQDLVEHLREEGLEVQEVPCQVINAKNREVIAKREIQATSKT